MLGIVHVCTRIVQIDQYRKLNDLLDQYYYASIGHYDLLGNHSGTGFFPNFIREFNLSGKRIEVSRMKCFEYRFVS